MNKNVLLNNGTARKLYKYVKDFPIFDYHCHLSVKEMYENKPYNNITEIWLKGDHYKWRQISRCSRPRWATRFICGPSSSSASISA